MKVLKLQIAALLFLVAVMVVVWKFLPSQAITGGAFETTVIPTATSSVDYTSKPATPSSVLFVDASGALGQDNTNLFWDYTNHFLGIGTTTPTTPLQVTVSGSNSTSTITVGKIGQNKGSCLELFNNAGSVTYCSITGTTLNCSATSCK